MAAPVPGGQCRHRRQCACSTSPCGNVFASPAGYEATAAVAEVGGSHWLWVQTRPVLGLVVDPLIFGVLSECGGRDVVDTSPRPARTHQLQDRTRINATQESCASPKHRLPAS